MSCCQEGSFPWCLDGEVKSDSPDCSHGPEGDGEKTERMKIGSDPGFICHRGL